MIELNVANGKIWLFDSIKNLPNARKLLFDQCSLWADGIGTGLSNVRQNLMNAKRGVLDGGGDSNVNSYIENADIGLSALMYGEDFELKQFTTFVHSYKETEQTQLKVELKHYEEIEQYNNLLNHTLGVTVGQVEETLELIKKNSEEN
jgi:hypothetical protein